MLDNKQDHAKRIISEMFSEFKRLLNPYYLLTIYVMSCNKVERQYKDSFLGTLWSLLQPLSQIVIYALILQQLMRFNVEHYALFLVSTLLAWNFMTQSFMSACDSLIVHNDVIKRCLVSKTVFPLAEIGNYFYHYSVSFVVMYIFCALMYWEFNHVVFYLPIFLIPFLLILASVCVALAIVTPFVRDIRDIVYIGMNISFWLTPIVYPLAAIPDKYQWLYEFNPFYIMIRPLNAIIYQGRLPNWYEITVELLLLVVTAVVSYAIYRLCRRNFIYYL